MRNKLNRKKYSLQQIILYIIGISFMPLGVVLTINSHLGSGGIDSFNFAMADKLKIKTSLAIYITAFVVVLLTAYIRKNKPRFTTFISSLLLGFVTDFWKKVFIKIEGTTMAGSVVLLLIGLLVIGFAVAAYMKSGFPTSPTDDMIVAFHEKGISIRLAKIVFDLVFVVMAFLLGGEFGIGTFICTFFLGPIINIFYNILDKPKRIMGDYSE